MVRCQRNSSIMLPQFDMKNATSSCNIYIYIYIGERDGGGRGGAVAPPKPEKTLFFGQQALEIWASTKQSLQKRKRL